MKSTKQATWRQGSIMYSITPLNGGGSITRNMWQRCGSEGSCRGSSGSIIARSGMLPMRRGQDTTPEWYHGSFHAASMPQVVMLCRVEGLEEAKSRSLPEVGIPSSISCLRHACSAGEHRALPRDLSRPNFESHQRHLSRPCLSLYRYGASYCDAGACEWRSSRSMGTELI